MSLFLDLLYDYLKDQHIEVSFPNLKVNAAEIIQIKSYQMLQEIKAVLDDETISDQACFLKIDAIIQIFEEHGIGINERHDFG